MAFDPTTLNYLLGPAVLAAVIAYFLKIWGERNDIRRRQAALVVGLLAELRELRRIHTSFRDSLDLVALGERIDADDRYLPFTTADPSSSRKLFEEMKSDLTLLDEDVLSSIVRVYGEDGRTQTMVLDIRTGAFIDISAERKKAYFGMLFEQADRTVTSADKAISLLEAARAR